MLRRIGLLCVMVVVAAFASPASALLVPANTEYVVPAGATLVFAEDYGSDSGLDGQGSWVSVGSANSVTVFGDYVQLEASNAQNLASQMLLPFNCYTDNYVLDIGIKQWTSANAPGSGIWSGVWGIHSSTWGNGPYYRAVIRNDNGGVIGPRGSSSEVALAVGEVNVLRFSGKSGQNIFTNTNETSGGAMSTLWNGGSSNRLKFFSEGVNGQCTMQLSWIKIYTGVDIDEAPLVSVPEPMTLSILAVSGLFMLRRRRSN